MPSNVEIKARLENYERQFQLAEKLSGSSGELIQQRDVFFRCETGRLKLRIFSAQRGELIAYERPDQSGPKTSQYIISATDQPDVLRETLARALEVTAEVVKRRTLFLVGRTRIHLDQVESLGDFLELEVVMKAGESIDAAQREAKHLMADLEIDSASLIEGAYVDLLAG